jgi:hypothetical protein
MRRLAPFLVVLLLCSRVSAQGTATAEGTRLLWKLAPGMKLAIEMEQAMNQQMQIAGNNMETKSNTTTWMSWMVKSVDKQGTAIVESTITRVLMTVDAPMAGETTYDSDTKEEPQGIAANLASIFKPMIGVPLIQTQNALGEIVSVEIPDGALKGFEATPVGGMGKPKDMFEQMTKNASMAFPDKDLEIGTEWERSAEMASPVGKIEVKNKYTYAGPVEQEGRTLHRINVDIEMQFKAEENALGARIAVTDQDTAGALFFDAEAGLLDHSEVEQDVTMQISAAGQEFQQKMKQLIKTKFTKVE